MKQRFKSIGVYLFISYTYCFQSFAQTGHSHETADSLAVLQTINGFVDAFSNLNWQKFTSYFAGDATAFFPPSAKFPYRANNKTEN